MRAGAPRTVPSRALLLGALCLLFYPDAAAQPPAESLLRERPAPASYPDPIVPWLGLPSDAPPILHYRHDIRIGPPGAGLSIRESRWQADRLKLLGFGGSLGLVGVGTVSAEAPLDLATTVTLETIDLNAVLRYLQLPRAEEIEGRVSGTVHLSLLGREWRRIDVALHAPAGTVRIHRRLIADVLTTYLSEQLSREEIYASLDQAYRGIEMIPFDAVRVNGRFDQQTLNLRVPLRNEILNLDLEPRIERAILWDLWDLLRRTGFEELEDIEWRTRR